MSPSTATDSNNNNCYDVFISHRASDVKNTFSSHLYRRLISYGLRVFLEYQDLGEDFTSHIESPIRTASVNVAIFSPRYADSMRCLNELLLMLRSGVPIIPVYHHVEPADLRCTHRKGVYARSLHNLERKRGYDSQTRYNPTTIKDWRDALSSVADISGLDLVAFNGDEGELLDKVVEVVLKKCRKTQLYVARYPTGLDEKVEDFETKVLLPEHGEGVQVVGITGLGGAGKTTLAKELFNRKSSDYRNSYFLFDVRENVKKSFTSLQRSLLKGLTQSDQQIDSIDQGMEMLKRHFSVLSSPVLLVLDDVDHVDQVHALLPVTGYGIFPLPTDSLILITSRDKNVLAMSGVPEASIYNLTGLTTKPSRELFCSHAFAQPYPLSGFESLVDQYLTACNGLPLSLKVFGGLLYGNTDKSYWENGLERLEQILPEEIQMRLQISYDALPRAEKQIFLDIACFFIGKNRDTAIRVWNGSGWNGSWGFRSLLNKGLVEVDIYGFNDLEEKIENCIRMHDHLRDLGRQLAKDPVLPKRFWHWTENFDDLSQHSSVVTQVRGIRMFSSEYKEDYNFSSYKIRNLQLLDSDADLVECILRAVCSPNLIWLRWCDCPYSSLPPWIPMKNLRVLHVSGEKLETLWQDELRAPLQLRELEIDAPLSSIPKSIRQLKHLERIVVRRTVREFETFPEEICHLPSLKHLHFTGFHELPSIGTLVSLEELQLPQCVKMKSIRGLVQLTRLRVLDISGCFELEELPSVDHLTSLEKLQACNCEKLKSIHGLAQLAQLGELDVSGCSKIEELPGLEYLMSLEVLRASGCVKLKSILGLEQLKHLQELDVSYCYQLEELPSVEHLWSLGELQACNCVKLKSIQGLAPLRKLRILNVCECYNMEVLEGVEHLKSLEELNFSGCPKLRWGCGAVDYPNLQRLRLHSRNALVEAGTLPSTLIILRLNCPNSVKIRGLETLLYLEDLDVSRCVKLKTIRGLALLTRLRILDVSNCSELEELPGVEHLRMLERVYASGCYKLKSIRGLEKLTKLQELDVCDCCELEELPGVEHCMSLETLHAFGCPQLQWDGGVVEQLRERVILTIQ